MRGWAGLPLLVVACLGALGCGYRYGLGPGLPAGGGVRTVGIEIFGNESPVPDVERDLHAAMSAAATSYVDATLVRPDAARFVVRGRVRSLRRQPGIRSSRNRVLETREVLVVEALLEDRRSGEVINETSALARVGYTLDALGQEALARDRALRLAADRVVLSLLAGAVHGTPELESLGDPAATLDETVEDE